MLVAAASAPAPAAMQVSSLSNLRPSFLEISINGEPTGEAVLVIRDAAGGMFVPEPALRAWRLGSSGGRAIEWDGQRYIALADLAGLTADLDEETQTLSLTAVPELFEASTLRFEEGTAPMTPSGWGGFLNYEFLGQYADGETILNTVAELGAFNGFGVGLASFIGGWSSEKFDFTRLETNWTVDDPRRMRSLRLGDSISRGGVGGAPLRFGGVQFGRNFAVRPGFLTFPTPSLGGGAAVPSVVDVYVNNTLRDTRKIAPGPFRVLDIPVVTGTGEVQLIVRDLLGRETVISQSYYAAPQLLRNGLQDYSYEIGFLREGFGRESNSYGGFLVSGTHRYGFSDYLTGEVHLAATKDVQTAGAAADLLLGDIGLVSAAAASSNSDRGIGGLLRLGFERRTLGFSLGGAAEFTTEDYAVTGLADGRRSPASTVQLFMGLPTGFGSLGASYLRRDGRGEPDAELLSANASVRLGALGALHLAGRKSFTGERETAVELFLTLPIRRRTSASASLQHRGGDVLATAAIQKNPLAGEGIGYRVSAATGDVNRVNGRLSYQADFGNYDAELSWTDRKMGVRVVAGGSIGTVGGSVFAARKLTQSFAAVRVGNYDNVRVYADNQPVGRTNKKGVVIVPRLRPYEKNIIRLEVADLPIDAQLAGAEQAVRPYNRSGIEVRFDVKPAGGALLELFSADGEPLPAGAMVRLAGGAEEFVIAPGGQVYLTGLKARNEAEVSLGEKNCKFSFHLPKTDDPQPRLGPYTCELGAS